jgi:hypothetical protein
LTQLKRDELANELERSHSLDPADVPKESQFLLNFDIDDLAEGDIFRQEQWILAMRAACRAGMRARGRSRRWAVTIHHCVHFALSIQLWIQCMMFLETYFPLPTNVLANPTLAY